MSKEPKFMLGPYNNNQTEMPIRKTKFLGHRKSVIGVARSFQMGMEGGRFLSEKRGSLAKRRTDNLMSRFLS